MKLSLKEYKLILKWFEICSGDLGDNDLKLFDKINEYVDETDLGDEEVDKKDELFDELTYYSDSGDADDVDDDDTYGED